MYEIKQNKITLTIYNYKCTETIHVAKTANGTSKFKLVVSDNKNQIPHNLDS